MPNLTHNPNIHHTRNIAPATIHPPLKPITRSPDPAPRPSHIIREQATIRPHRNPIPGHHIAVKHITRTIALPTLQPRLIERRLRLSIRGAEARIIRPREKVLAHALARLDDGTANTALGRCPAVAGSRLGDGAEVVAVAGGDDDLEGAAPAADVGGRVVGEAAAEEGAFVVCDAGG